MVQKQITPNYILLTGISTWTCNAFAGALFAMSHQNQLTPLVTITQPPPIKRPRPKKGGSQPVGCNPVPTSLLPHMRLHLDPLGLTWIHLDSLGFIWTHLDSFGSIWTPLDSLGSTRTHLNSRAATWIPLDSLVFGVTWTDCS